MPLMQIFTTLARSQIPENLGQLVATALSKTLRNKPIERICVHIAADQLIFAGSQAELPNGPTAYAILRSIGSVELEDNRRTVEEITELLHEQLDLPRSEIRMMFVDFAPEMIGMNGRIATDIFVAK